MADVTVNNPKVQVDLFTGENLTVPSGERWEVTIMPSSNGRLVMNGTEIVPTGGPKFVQTTFFGGDSLAAYDDDMHLRGYRVD